MELLAIIFFIIQKYDELFEKTPVNGDLRPFTGVFICSRLFTDEFYSRLFYTQTSKVNSCNFIFSDGVYSKKNSKKAKKTFFSRKLNSCSNKVDLRKTLKKRFFCDWTL